MRLPARSPSGAGAARALALVAALVAVLAALLATAPPAHAAGTYVLQAADVVATVQKDGSVAIREDITVSFSGSFTFGYRDVPLRDGERIDAIGVSEGGRAYGPGAPTALEPGGPAGTFGIEERGSRVRIVWRFQAGSETRTFTVRYRLSGLAVAYDDVVDVNLKVWGDEWQQSLGRLTARMTGPGKVVKAWGHPVWVRGDVTLDGRSALLRAIDVPARQYVELRALYPRRAFTTTSAMKVESGNGLDRIVQEELDDAAAYEKDQQRLDDALAHPWRTALILLALGTLPAVAITGVVFWFFGREVSTGYDREYEQEPPTDTGPALVPTLLRQGGERRLVRVHRHALRPDPAGALPCRARHHRAQRLGRPAHRDHRRPRALARRAGRAHAVGEEGRGRRRRRDRLGARSGCRASASRSPRSRGDERALRGLQGRRRRARSTGAAGSGRSAPCRSPSACSRSSGSGRC